MLKILTVEGCAPCDELKELVKELVEAGEVQFVEGTSDEGMKILKDNEDLIHAVPFAFVEEGGKIRQCKVKYEEDGIVFDCDGGVVDVPNSPEAPVPIP